MSNWIWLDPAEEPGDQTCFACLSAQQLADRYPYAVAEFCRTYSFEKAMTRVSIRVSGDTVYRFRVNDRFAGQGPVSPGGDFLCLDPMPAYYASCYDLPVSGKELRIFAQVRLGSVVDTEYSCCRGGWLLEGTVEFSDGTREEIRTDESWLARKNPRFPAPHTYDGTLPEKPWHRAKYTGDERTLLNAPIPNLWEGDILPLKHRNISVPAGQTRRETLIFDKIYPAYLCLHTDGPCRVSAEIFELEEQSGKTVNTVFAGPEDWRSFSMYSTGGYRLEIENTGKRPVTLETHGRMTCYPVTEEGSFRCSDPELTKVYDLCKWTLQICRQTLHLDSTTHQEPLACTGDYYIEALMTAMTFGDMRLAALDVIRTARWLSANDGRMFHTTYSLIWVRMAWEVYRFTGDREMLAECMPALKKLMARFRTYLGDNGLVENPPDFMFVDWLITEGYSMHHPPKALGQSVMNAFYHGALLTAGKICRELGLSREAKSCTEQAAGLKKAFRNLLWDEKEGLFFDGLPTPQPAQGKWRPENVPIRHFSRHTNILAVLCGLTEGKEARELLRRTVTSRTMQQVQPYFMHFCFDALWKTGLFPEYGMELLNLWKPLARECGKGLKEGWFAPEGYSFDHSHAWGGTPAYQIPARLLGLEILEPGMKKISLSPDLLGLDWFDCSVPTPMGMIRVSMHRGEQPAITVPPEIRWTVTDRLQAADFTDPEMKIR